MGWTRFDLSVLVLKTSFLASFLNSRILTAYMSGFTIEVK